VVISINLKESIIIFMAEKKKIILVAEDEKPMARALELKLEGSGFEVNVVHDGEAALLEILKGKYDLALLDLMMPKKDGFEVLEQLQLKGNKTPVIVSSNLSQEEDIKKAKVLGAVDYYVKSDTTISKVIEHIKTVLKIK
jgi:DNA-binding response OmpR family regulator